MIDALPVKAHIFKHKHQGKYQNTTGPSVIKCIVHKAPLTRQMQCSSRPTLLAASLSGKQIQQADVRHTCALEHQASNGSDSQRPSTPDGTPVLITYHPSYLLRLPEAERFAAMAAFEADLGRAVEMVGA